MSTESSPNQPPAFPTTPFDSTPMMMASVGRFTIGFVSIGKDRAYSKGSGTLIKFSDVAGILTCAHVLEEVLQEPEIGILCFPARPAEIQCLKFKTELARHVSIKSSVWSEAGPDLAFLQLPPSVMAAVEKLASVVNGIKQHTDAFAEEPKPSYRSELICGVVDLLTQATIDGTASVTRFTGLLNVGEVVQKYDKESLDIYRFRPMPGEDFALPTSYKGSSGGGLWRIYAKQEIDGTFSVMQSRLIGVAYWEKPINEELHIMCHGQNSIYVMLYKQIQEMSP